MTADTGYDPQEVIGRGGMATVYRARDRGAEMDVALKVLHEHLMDDEGIVEAFEREAALMGRIDHPGVVRVYGRTQFEGRPAIAMELCEGGSLAKRLSRRGAMSEEEALEVMRPLLEALEAIHDQNVVHRDVKPHNVVFDAEGAPRWIDFGIGQAEELMASDEAGQVGTVEYMAPERIDGFAVDARSDLYGMGVMLFEMLCGHPPYRADTASAVVRMHREAEVSDPRLFASEVSQGVARAAMKAMAKHPEDRFDSAAEMLRGLDEEAEMTEPVEPHRKWVEARQQMEEEREEASWAAKRESGYEWVVYVPPEVGGSGGDSSLAAIWELLREHRDYRVSRRYDWRHFRKEEETEKDTASRLVRSMGIARGLSRQGAEELIAQFQEPGIPVRVARRRRRANFVPSWIRNARAWTYLVPTAIAVWMVGMLILDAAGTAGYQPKLMVSGIAFVAAIVVGVFVSRMTLTDTENEWWISQISNRYLLDFCSPEDGKAKPRRERKFLERKSEIRSPRIAASFQKAVHMALHLVDLAGRREIGEVGRWERVLEELYELGGQIVDLESQVAAIRPGRLVGEIRELDRRIGAATEVDDVEEWIEDKAELRRQLEARDAAFERLEMAAQRLLNAAGELESLVRRLREGGEGDDEVVLDFASVSADLLHDSSALRSPSSVQDDSSKGRWEDGGEMG